MKTTKLNFTMPQDVAERLKARVGRRKRSAFVAEAVLEKLKEIEREHLCAEMREGYQARQEEDTDLYREWDEATREEWPR